VQQESEADARRRSLDEKQRERRELYEAGVALLEASINEAAAIVQEHVVPLQLAVNRNAPSGWIYRSRSLSQLSPATAFAQ
jgi:hypothetical protein